MKQIIPIVLLLVVAALLCSCVGVRSSDRAFYAYAHSPGLSNQRTANRDAVRAIPRGGRITNVNSTAIWPFVANWARIGGTR